MSNVDIYTILSSKPHNSYFLSHYYRFIEKCRQANSLKTKGELGYTEKHHICPKAKDLFPEYTKFKDHPWNKIILTGEQHFIAHKLLWKAYGGSQTDAFWLMAHLDSNQMTPSTYAILKKNKVELIIILHTGRVRPEETLKKLSIAKKGHKQTPEHVQKRISKTKGKTRSKEQREKMSERRKGKRHSDETREKLSKIAKARKYSDEAKAKMSEYRRSKIIYKFINDNHKLLFVGTRYEFEQKVGIKVNMLFAKMPRKTVNGWRVEQLLDTSSEVHHTIDQKSENSPFPH